MTKDDQPRLTNREPTPREKEPRDAHMRPCPFCDGKEVKTMAIRDGTEAYCMQCGASVRAYNPNSLGHAKVKWNTRSGDVFFDNMP